MKSINSAQVTPSAQLSDSGIHGARIEIHTVPDVEEFTCHEGRIYRKMRTEAAIVLFRSPTDPEVAVMLVGRLLVVVSTDPYPDAGEFPSGRRELVRTTIAIGRLHPTADNGIATTLWTWQYGDDALLPVFHREILDWWRALSTEERLHILEFIDDAAPIPF